MLTITVKDAMDLETSLKTISYRKTPFTVAAPAIKNTQNGTELISISLQPQSAGGSAPFTPEGVNIMRTYFQREFAVNPNLQNFKFIDVEWIQIIISADNQIKKWQITAVPKDIKGGLGNSATKSDLSSRIAKLSLDLN